ncbi:MAG: helix-turn-helix domain-containing protein [Candidatus Thiodiazotropha sp. (ex Cardiolucina cf. quadrata)]|nr:helix-turn-helix domain-containing protein [Candidatus Thiodiazotropha sp. (ex Cardiolucina cf. quadrata)]
MSYNQLTENERYKIYTLKKAGHSRKEIAKLVGRSPSTICRGLRHIAGIQAKTSTTVIRCPTQTLSAMEG